MGDIETSKIEWGRAFDSISDGICLMDMDGKILRCNKTMKVILGKEENAIVGRNCWEVVHGAQEPMENCLLTEMKKNKKKASSELTLGKRIFNVTVDPIFDDKGELKNAVHIISDITERKKSDETMQESAERYRTLFENASDAIFTMAEYKFIECNEMTLKIFGCKQEDIIGHAPWEFSPSKQPDGSSSEEKAKEFIESAFEGKVLRFYWKHAKKDKTPFDAEVSLSLMTVGEKKFLQAIVRDITERKQAEDSFRRLTGIMENTSDLVSTATPDKRLTYLNSAGRELIGWKEDEDLADKKISDVHPKWARDIIDSKGIPTAIQDGIWRGETALLRTDGTEIPVSQVIMSHKSETGDVEYLSTIMRDISKEKQAEEELKQSEEWYRSLIENSASVYSVVDAKGNAIYQSPSIERVYGWKPEEIKGKPLFERIHPDDLEQIVGGFKKLLENPKEVIKSETRYRHKDGSWRTIDALGANHLDNPAIRGIMITSHDITERKIAEEKLRESEKKFRAIFDQSAQLLAILSPEGKIIEVNEKITQLPGFKRSLIGKPFWDKVYWPDSPELWDSIHDLVIKASNGEFVSFEAREVHDNSLHVTDNIIFPVRDNKGDILFLVATALDITERKKAEEALRESKEKYRELVENINDIIYTVDKEGIIQYMSPAIERASGGFKPSDLEGRVYNEYIHPDDVERITKEFKVRISGKSGTVEYRTNTKTGEILWIRDSSRPIMKDGEVIGVQGVMRDITEYKEAEEKFRNVFQSTPMGIHMYQLDSDDRLVFIGANPAADKILGVDNQQFIGKTIEEAFPPLKETDVPERYSLAAGEGEIWDTEQIEYEDEKIKGAFEVHAFQTSPGKMVALFRDITNRKQTEEKLRESEEKFRSLISHIPGVVWRTDTEGNTSFISPLVKNIYGFTPKEISKAGDSLWFGRIHPDDVEKVQREFRNLFEKGTHLDMEYRIQRKDGKWIWLKDRSFGTFEQDGMKYADGVFFDITEQKKAEQEISNIFNLSKDLLCIIDLNSDRFMEINPSFETILGHEGHELQSRPYTEFVHPKDIRKTQASIRGELPGTVHERYFENRLLCKDGNYKWFGWSITPVTEEGVTYAVGRDISEQKMKEQEFHKRLMNYKIDEGNMYLVLEKKPDKTLEAFRDLLNAGYEGIIFSRTPVREFERYIDKEFDFAWMAESDNRDAVPPDMKRIEEYVNGLPAHETILLDRLDYLITKNGFDETLSFVHKLRELSYLKDHIVLISLDATTLSEKERGLVEKECLDLVPLHETMISQELMEIMKYIYKRNQDNVSSSYDNLTEELTMSRPTARNRIGTLVGLGYLVETKKGRRKVFEFTEKGRNLFH
jgi:PAS domain S-box-containing protein